MLYMGYEPEVGGIGDFVYILFQTYCWCRKNHLKMGICIPSHKLNKCISCIEREPDGAEIHHVITHENINCKLTDVIASIPKNDVVVYGNMNDYLHIFVKYMDKRLLNILLQEFKKYVFQYTDFIENRISTLIENTIQTTQYVAIHLRCGDKFLRKNKDYKDYRIDLDGDSAMIEVYEKIQRAVDFLNEKYPNIPICLFCDNAIIREQVSEKFGFLYFSTQIVHIGDDETTECNGVYDSFCEFVILGRAQCVFSITRSNFSNISSFVHGAQFYTFVEGEIVQPNDF